ncbi:cbb3-type cytochrome oxidase assembly protein CcoS [Helicobacter sp. 10-6591]|uniref:cbb3-type cytochrome oxidase assembly protein CcoS n=1 Tax=Helicobacter sp. 10-6591 TaxID=2004998 RepID=UPI000DCF23EE|nr:cbb3-type cytochrome oxidase assembly protein CcoS [Helicobacter sp. 10-6591]RAX55043.1 cbb3-type cytochrome oxidase assembly protein CcoS [Helicobacter sp. 10-6591]
MGAEVIVLMLTVSLILGFFGLLAFLWGLRNGQFDDENKMMEGVLFDSPDDLNKMINQNHKRDFLQHLPAHKSQHKERI